MPKDRFMNQWLDGGSTGVHIKTQAFPVVLTGTAKVMGIPHVDTADMHQIIPKGISQHSLLEMWRGTLKTRPQILPTQSIVYVYQLWQERPYRGHLPDVRSQLTT